MNLLDLKKTTIIMKLNIFKNKSFLTLLTSLSKVDEFLSLDD